MDQDTANPMARFVNGSAFSGDMFRREQHAERLTAYLERLREGAVVAVDAPWGEGKTWFGRNWAAYLQAAGHTVVFIDALAQDYVEEPFLLIAAEIADALDNGHGAMQGLRKKAADVMNALLPTRTRTVINYAEQTPPNPAGPLQHGHDAPAIGADDAGNWFERKIENHARESASFQHFRDELSALAARQPKSLVLFIDELDRCQPGFTLKLIERLRNFFDIPNLVFVLLVNRNQLHQAICRVHGLDTDAAAYLSEFIHFVFTLPKKNYDDYPGSRQASAYVEHAFSRYEFDDSPGLAMFKACFTWTAAWLDLSMRDIERAVALYAFAYPVEQHNYLLAYVIALKIGRPDLFARLRKSGDLNAHREALDMLKPIRAGTMSPRPHRYLALLMEWHEAHVNGFAASGDTFTLLLREYDQRSGDPLTWRDLPHDELWDAQRRLFQVLAERIDGTE
ncbi:KAP family P-loop NTPase fold protein [Noviherbaspirillum malthae]|uniref:KAP family P-loop NTPase fold protein n=1 Tax=Noviherbaspirillum malthae TaxID=1260987 RepID=UPI00188FC450|nr:P-loop NTPase fold protein [Noviherbaspirillum malthae]